MSDEESKGKGGTWRPTVAWITFVIAGIVFMSYHYTWAMFSDAIAILTSAAEPSDVKDGVIQLLGAVAQSIVAVGAISALAGPLNKLVEK